ncbi:30S ribosomal protein S6 [Candidatus Shapirobacteria bacterium CG03_land_8_20_14_0_80_39_12]|uniref:Small ribosomal subunit protein bS6 n=1 Tax=Candidatus Shapirobacteria bacterium CG03_land_8_20_14_0_80_39_12 TaxID=1974879 RepID=A0A2M7BCN5_9BACT|nr:MAG: 30S ribosomal protein S6 [Candidatus Shapirobacteria bacterium CG03_land_8_20_14_0_80_39_12]
MTKTYELVVILDPELKTEEQEKLLAKIKKIITDLEGKVSSTKEWGKKDLSYSIAKKKSGVFYILNIEIPPAGVVSLRQKLSLEEKILRYLLVVKEA